MRRKKAGWAAYNSISNVIEHTRDDELRATLFNSTVLPALSYASETWSLTKNLENQLRRMQMSLERWMVGITLHQQRLNRLHNENIRSLSNVRDIILPIDKAKHTFAGHLIRRDDGRWSTTSVCWEPREKKRPRGQPPLRWQDSLAHRNNICDSNSIKTSRRTLPSHRNPFTTGRRCHNGENRSRHERHLSQKRQPLTGHSQKCCPHYS
ncbi:hypothetical protein V3C99_015048 [Haemonchus contortus]